MKSLWPERRAISNRTAENSSRTEFRQPSLFYFIRTTIAILRTRVDFSRTPRNYYRTRISQRRTLVYFDDPFFSFHRTTENLASTPVALKKPKGDFRRLTGNLEANANLQSPNIERWLQSPNPERRAIWPDRDSTAVEHRPDHDANGTRLFGLR